jgi:membrane protein DedA with SNARE-associated domain
MTDAIIEAVTSVTSTPWVFVALFLVAAIDAFFPAVPGETLVITAGVFAASTGEPNLLLVIVAATLGAFVGDHVSFGLGRWGGSRVLTRVTAGSRTHRTMAWADRALQRRGGLILVIARYIPGGRTAATLTAGTVGYPLRRFTFFDAIAASSWATYSALIGFVGGASFEDDPLKGLVFGLGIAFGISVAVEVVRAVRRRTGRGRVVTGNDTEVVPERQIG